jgi:integrase
VQAITLLSEARKRRFLRSKRPKYGSMNKGFTQEELERFFRFVECPKLRLLFAYQATLGLRIGEAVRLNISDFNLRTQELRIFTEKSGKTDFLLVPAKLFGGTMEYISAYEKEISACRGYLFFSLAPGNRGPTTQPFLATGTVRKHFRDIAEKAGLGEHYGYRYGEKAHPLHRLTTHSLRHYAITNFSRKNNGNVTLASKFARHSNLQTTMTYIHTEKEELYRSIRNSQNDGVLEKVKKLQKGII